MVGTLRSSGTLALGLLCTATLGAALLGAGACSSTSGGLNGTGGAGVTTTSGNANGGSGGVSLSVGSGGGVPDGFHYDCSPGEAFKDPSLPDDVCGQFDGQATSDGAPGLVYPLDGSMHAKNQGRITFHWSRGSASNSVFRIDINESGEKRYKLFVPCSEDECVYEMPLEEWLEVGWYLAGGGPISVTIAGTDGQGGPVATSEALELSFSPTEIEGAVYYWAAEKREIKRADFGAAEAVAFISPNSESNDYDCVACHSVSRDGKVIAFAVTNEEGEDIAAIQAAPTVDPNNPFIAPQMGDSPYKPGTSGPTEHFGHNVALNRDGSRAAVNSIPYEADQWPPQLEIWDTSDGAVLNTYPMGDTVFGANKVGILPEWSPNSERIVVTLADSTGDDATFGCVWTSDTCRSAIAIHEVSDDALGPAQVLVEATGSGDQREYHFYPSWSPNGDYVVFVSATWSASDPNQKSLSNPNAIIRMVPTTGGPHSCPGPSCWELERGMGYTAAAAQSGQGLQSTWPKFAPFAQGSNDSLVFVSINSKRDYGFLAADRNQIWMFAIDLSNLDAGDPSYAPFWLPYQDPEDGSLEAYWTEVLPCEVDDDGNCFGCAEGETCYVDESSGECKCSVPIVK